jgi:hypothetical protein
LPQLQQLLVFAPGDQAAWPCYGENAKAQQEQQGKALTHSFPVNSGAVASLPHELALNHSYRYDSSVFTQNTWHDRQEVS